MITLNDSFPKTYKKDKRVFYDFNSFLTFFSSNRDMIKDLKIVPPKLGSSNFGYIEVKVKSFVDAAPKKEKRR